METRPATLLSADGRELIEGESDFLVAEIKRKWRESASAPRPPLKPWNTVKEVAAYLDVSPWTIYRAKTRIGFRPRGGRLMFAREDVEAFERGGGR